MNDKSTSTDENKRLSLVSSILVSQPKPSNGKSPYFELQNKYGVKIDFRPFIEIDPVEVKEFRRQKINFLDFSAVIFTSRNAVDHYFRLALEMKLEIPSSMKYFCISEQTANYLHKYITIRKRKIFTGQRTAQDLLEVLEKHKTEKYVFPCSNIRKNDIPNFLRTNKFIFKEAIIYRTVSSDLSDLAEVNYDLIVFYSPSGILSLFENFPSFKQNSTRIAAFGPSTSKAVEEAGLILDVKAPMPNTPSMTGALENYIKIVNRLT